MCHKAIKSNIKLKNNQKEFVIDKKRMRSTGLEPAQDYSHKHLKLACLPFHHGRNKQNYYILLVVFLQ